MPRPVSHDQHQLIITLYASGVMFKDIATRAGITVRGCQKIVANAREAGDTRAALRGCTEAQREQAKIRMMVRRKPKGIVPAGTFIHGMGERAAGGVDSDFEESRW